MATASTPVPGSNPPVTNQHLQVTQVVSFVFYVVPFLLQWLRYDPSSMGLGLLAPDNLKVLEPDPTAKFFFKTCLFLVIGFNAVRYYWSAFLVESDPSFTCVRGALSTGCRRFEYFLRMCCLVILYIIPMTLNPQAKGGGFEFMLCCLYLALVGWDLLLYYLGTFNGDSERLRKSIRFWLFLEGFGLLITLGYLGVVNWMARTPTTALAAVLLIVFAAALFGVLGALDFWKHRSSYFQQAFLKVFIPSLLFAIVVVYVTKV